MSGAETKQAHAVELRTIRDEAEEEAGKAARAAKAWKWLGRITDVLAILLAAIAAATSGIALAAVFVAVPAGIAAACAAIGTTVRPGQLAARASSKQGDWAQLVSSVDGALGSWDGLTQPQATAEWAALRDKRDAIRKAEKPKRSQFIPETW